MRQEAVFVADAATEAEAEKVGVDLDNRGMLDWNDAKAEYLTLDDEVELIGSLEDLRRAQEFAEHPKLPGMEAP